MTFQEEALRFAKMGVNFAISLVLIAFYHLVNLARQFIPYKYRSKSVAGEVVLVTGAGSGIGKLMAKKLAALGATLVLVDIDEKNNKKTKDEIIKDNGVAHAFTCDLSDRLAIYKTADEIKKTVDKKVTFLINNAGIVTGKKFMESSDAAIEKTMQVNTMAHFWLVKSFLPDMLERNHGHIVTIASMAGISGTAGLCDYCASKFAAVGFDESLRNELNRINKTGVVTTVVCPYLINTGMFQGAKTSAIDPLEPEYVASKVVEAILTNQRVLYLPKLMYILAFMKSFMPFEAESYTANYALETNFFMDGFVGRKKAN